MATVTGTSSLVRLVRRARRRRVLHVLVQRAAIACAIGLAAIIILLITGTDILNWYWPVLLFAGSLAILVLSPRSPISDYQLAQEIDRRLKLHDSLSTALYFGLTPHAPAAADDVVLRQRRAAEEHAAAADLSRAIPFIATRSMYVSGCLAMMVFGLFAARYGIRRSLDLHPALVHIAFRGLAGDGSANPAASNAARKARIAREKAAEAFEPALASDPADGAQNSTPHASLQPVNSALRPGAGSPGPVRLNSGESPEDAAGENSAAAANRKDSSPQNGGERTASAGAKPSEAENGQPQTGAQNQSAQDENSSLMDRMRDAMTGLLSKLGMQRNSAESKQSSARGGNQSSGTSRSNGRGTPTQEQAQNGALTPDGQANANGNTGATMQSAHGRSDQKSGDSSDSPDSRSGIGRQDGSKDPKLADQLAAMGKISEIIGRRSRTVTGEVMVEVPSGKEQKLSTAYSGRKAAHADDAGEISRDEVPLVYQQYVQDYFEQIRKLPVPKPETRR